jgi:HD superfamily phosphohydrolase
MIHLKGTNKFKIINDPVYGFINIPFELYFDILQHPYFQRLRRIKQLGLSSYVYPGAVHTRFDHVLGAGHLMGVALKELERKGHIIGEDEKNGAILAILLHDIGHGPFSHSLEGYFFEKVGHECLTFSFMQYLNRVFKGQLDLGIQIFKNDHSRKFLHQLVSGQLDTDRLDYLKRDSFYTGVTEGGIGTDRLLKMLNVVDDRLVVEEKGIYTVEQFIVARRIMYWQVYLHKTVIAAEEMLKKAMQRAKDLYLSSNLFVTPALAFFLNPEVNLFDRNGNIFDDALSKFAEIDDSDILVCLKEWKKSGDKVLSILAGGIIDRKLFKVEISELPFQETELIKVKQRIKENFGLNDHDAGFLVTSEKIVNRAYSLGDASGIRILTKSGIVSEISEVSDIENITALSKPVEKYFMCYPKNIDNSTQ